MSMLDFLKKNSASPQQLSSQYKDGRQALCPYCKATLPKIPGSKTKCPHCGKFMYVRTRPKDNAQIVVTKEEADEIEEDWSIVAGTHDEYLADRKKVSETQAALKTKFGKEPSENDVKWNLLNKDLLENARKGNWGLYRNTRFSMGEILRRDLKLKQALQTYLEVCYLDLNGPNNIGGINDPEPLKQFLAFDPKQSAFLAPGVIKLIINVKNKLNIDKDSLARDFIDDNKRIQNSLKLPVAPEEAWNLIEREI